MIQVDDNTPDEAESDAPASRRGGRRRVFAVSLVGLGVFLLLALIWPQRSNPPPELPGAPATSSEPLPARGTRAPLPAELTALRREVQALQMRQQHLARQLQAVQEETPAGRFNLALAELEFLLSLAMHQMELGGRPTAARHTLQVAERRLHTLIPGTLDPVHEQVVQALAQLHTAAELDLSGLALHLAGLAGQADTLPLMPAVQPVQPTPTDATAGSQDEGGFWSGLLTHVRGMVKIQPREAFSGLPEQAPADSLRTALRLELGVARLAVLVRDQAGLQESLRQLLSRLDRHFDPASEQVRALREALVRMQTLNLRPMLPDLKPALESLRRVMEGQSAEDSASGSLPQH